jgi:MYXO-CTERM domain-containing protein
MKTIVTGCCVVLLLTGMALSVASPALAQNLVVNGDFETDTDLFVTWPGYVANGENPAEITGWTGEGGRGINPVVPGGPDDAPFRDNGNNTTSVAFLQGASAIEQTISGLTTGGEYVFGMDFNARNCCGDPVGMPIGTILVNGEVVGSSADLFPEPGAIPAVGGQEPWYHVDIPFAAPAESLTLRIASTPAVPGTDATMLVDNVSVVIPEPSSALLALLGLFGLVRCRPRRK